MIFTLLSDMVRPERKSTLLYWVTQKNLIEFQVQTIIPYILQIMVYVHTVTNLP